MDWNSKANSWDLGEFEQEAIPNVDAFDRSAAIGDHKSEGDFSVDLKLGRVGNSSGESVGKWKQRTVSKMESLPSGSTKRARAAHSGTQAVSCLVDGCNSDLSNCRDYHRRHKVCERHSKTPEVTIGGHKKRFCQQCSRFHSLEEFDEGKRSCRKRLDGHNRRRRKPQPDNLSRSGSSVSNFQGTQLLSFSCSHVYPSTPVANSNWPGVCTEADAKHYNLHQHIHSSSDKRNLFLGSSLSSYKGGKQFPFLQGDNPTTIINSQTPTEVSACQPLLGTIALSESNNIFCDRIPTTPPVRDSDCALSLLSSPQTQASENHIVQQPNLITLVHPINPNLHNHGLEPMDSVLVSSGGKEADVHRSGLMFNARSAESSGNIDSQTDPFSWE